jgi:hypothetical protein
MSYCRETEYEIVPDESFSVIRGCAGCGRKTHYVNTGKFRVNTNGNQLDVWLIYQCEKCKHTFNLTVYERQSVSCISKEEYDRFLANDESLAQQYGRDLAFFRRQRAEIDYGRMRYAAVRRRDSGDNKVGTCMLTIQNPYGYKIRTEKQIALITGLSASRIKRMMQEGMIEVQCLTSQGITVIFK